MTPRTEPIQGTRPRTRTMTTLAAAAALLVAATAAHAVDADSCDDHGRCPPAEAAQTADWSDDVIDRLTWLIGIPDKDAPPPSLPTLPDLLERIAAGLEVVFTLGILAAFVVATTPRRPPPGGPGT